MNSFFVMNNPKSTDEFQEFVPPQTEFLPSRVLMKEMIINKKGFIE